jgi:hypothetical protein
MLLGFPIHFTTPPIGFREAVFRFEDQGGLMVVRGVHVGVLKDIVESFSETGQRLMLQSNNNVGDSILPLNARGRDTGQASETTIKALINGIQFLNATLHEQSNGH